MLIYPQKSTAILQALLCLLPDDIMSPDIPLCAQLDWTVTELEAFILTAALQLKKPGLALALDVSSCLTLTDIWMSACLLSGPRDRRREPRMGTLLPDYPCQQECDTFLH